MTTNQKGSSELTGCEIPHHKVNLHNDDLPDSLSLGKVIAIDTEAMGLNPHRDRLCLVQLTDGSGTIHLIRIGHNPSATKSRNLCRILFDPGYKKIFHFARFDVGILQHSFADAKHFLPELFSNAASPAAMASAAFSQKEEDLLPPKICNIFCTKIAARLAMTYSRHHGLRDLCKSLLDIEISKEQQSSDWGGTLTEKQYKYAATDVAYLHRIMQILQDMLQREGRLELAHAAFNFIPYLTEMDLLGWKTEEVLAH